MYDEASVTAPVKEIQIMARRIVVGLDGSEYAANALRQACESAKSYAGTVIGVAVVDSPGIESSSLGAGIGAYEYARRAREQKLSDAHEHVKEFLTDFEKTCTEHGVPFELAYHDAVPFQAIVDEARCADLIMIGLRTYFHFETQEEAGDTLRHLMEVGICPVLAVPKIHEKPHNAVICYDGSLQAARAMRAFIHITSLTPGSSTITLLNVTEGTVEDEHVQIEAAQKYIQGYGFDVEVITKPGRASEVIPEVADEKGPCFIVMGAYGRRGSIKHMFFGSTANNLVRNEKYPLFVYH